MILEGVVTTLAPDGAVNIAPMGPQLSPPYALDEGSSFYLKPFRTSRTFANLQAYPEGVLHVTDDVLLLARAAIGPVEPSPALMPTAKVRGTVLADACRAFEFRIVGGDLSGERVRLHAEIVHVHRLRDFLGFNRARHAVVEAAILATRVHLLAAAHLEAEFDRLAVLVEKTGGPAEQEAFALLRRHVQGEMPV